MGMEKSIQKLGTVMSIVAWILILGLFFWGFNEFSINDKNYNENIKIQYDDANIPTVILQSDHNGHYTANGSINGVSVRFLIDTGATMVSIPKNIANQLNLYKGIPIKMNTANGTIITKATRLNSVTLGSIRLENVRASINPYMEGNEILLGMSFLKHLEFTKRGNQLILKQIYFKR
jgi:aspartyl protease family protein